MPARKNSNKRNGKKELVKSNRNPQISSRKKKISKKNGRSIDNFLSPCAWKYAKAVLDPFNTPAGACIPNVPAFPSKKIKTFTRFTFTTGAASMGFVCANPFNGVSATPATAICSTNPSTFSGTVITSTSVPTGGSAIFMNSPLTSTNFSSNDMMAKLVSFGIRVKNTSAPLYRQGSIHANLNPTHTSLNGANAANLDIDPLTFIDTVAGSGNDWVNLIYKPNDPVDFNMYTPSTSTTNLDATYGASMMGIIVDGTLTTEPQSYQVEMCGHYELFSRRIFDVTPSDSDPAGFAAVTSMLSSMKEYAFKGLRVDTGKLWNTLGSIASKTLSHFVVSAASVAMGSPYGGSLAGSFIDSATRSGPIIEEMN